MPDEKLARLMVEPSEDPVGIYAYKRGDLAILRIQQIEMPSNGKGITLYPQDLDKLIAELMRLRLMFRNA
jgi:hypothetical protein